jgi:hypothetical protein
VTNFFIKICPEIPREYRDKAGNKENIPVSTRISPDELVD